MTRPWRVILVFVASLAVMLGMMSWVSVIVLRLDRAQAMAQARAERETRAAKALAAELTRAQARAEREEIVRLALWRMDAFLVPLIAQESARPYFVYNPYYPTERTYDRMFNRWVNGEVLVPSPLLNDPPPAVLVYFQFDPAGRLTSPQVSTMVSPTTRPEMTATGLYADCLADLKRQVRREQLLGVLPAIQPSPPGWPEGGQVAVYRQDVQMQGQAQPAAQGLSLNQSQQAQPQMASRQGQIISPRNASRGQNEFQARYQATMNNSLNGGIFAGNQTLQDPNNQEVQAGGQGAPNAKVASSGGVQIGPMTPWWSGDTLLLARRVVVNGQVYVQGCQLDWRALKAELLVTVSDLLPSAELMPVHPDASTGHPASAISLAEGPTTRPGGSAAAPQERMLATLPGAPGAGRGERRGVGGRRAGVGGRGSGVGDRRSD